LQKDIEEAEAVFETLKETDIGDEKAFSYAKRNVQRAMAACIANFEQFMKLVVIDPKQTKKTTNRDNINQKVMTLGEKEVEKQLTWCEQ